MKNRSPVRRRAKRGKQLPKVLLTRAEGQNEELASALRLQGVDVVVVPVLQVAADTEAVKRALSSRNYDWIVITSPNGARTIAGKVPKNTKVAAVGKHTASAFGGDVDLIAEETNAEGLVAAFPNAPAEGGCVLVCRSDLADDTVVDGLATKGWTAVGVVTYVVSARDADDVSRALQAVGHIDAIVLASGSAARALPPTPVIPPVICIGPKTATAARELGLNVIATAETQDTEGLVTAVLRAVR